MIKILLNNYKKYLFFLFLLVLSIVLMINFKNKKNIVNFYGDAKSKIVSLIKNLKPIYAKTNLSNEDIFNFAFYRTLPLDKENNKVLLINNVNSEDIIEIKNLPINKTENLSSFLNFISSNDNDKQKVDSLLNYYKSDIYQNIFIGDESYAVNPNILLIRENLISDLLSVTYKINQSKAKVFFPINSFESLIKHNYANEIKNKMEFLLITKDSVYSTRFSFDKKKLEKQIMEIDNDALNLVSEIDRPFTKIKLDHDGKIQVQNINHFKLEDNDVKIILNKVLIKKNINDSIRKVIDENVTKKVRLFAKQKANVKINSTEDLIQFSNPNEVGNATLKLVRELNIAHIVSEALKRDSVHMNFVDDSIMIDKMHVDIKKTNKKLKKFNLDTIRIN